MAEPNLVGSITFGERLDAQDRRIDRIEERLLWLLTPRISYQPPPPPLDRVDLAAKLAKLPVREIADILLSENLQWKIRPEFAERIIAALDQWGALRP